MLYNTTQYFYLTVTEPLDIWKHFVSNNGCIYLVIIIYSTSELSTEACLLKKKIKMTFLSLNS